LIDFSSHGRHSSGAFANSGFGWCAYRRCAFSTEHALEIYNHCPRRKSSEMWISTRTRTSPGSGLSPAALLYIRCHAHLPGRALVFSMEPPRQEFRFLGWTYVPSPSTFNFPGRIYYLAPAYPMLFARAVGSSPGLKHGAAPLAYPESQGEIAAIGRSPKRKLELDEDGILAPLVVGGLVAAPLAIPILPLETASHTNFWM